MSACAADATSARKPTREGVDSGGNGPPIFYLNPIAAILRWRAMAFLFRREPVLQQRRPFRTPYHTTVPEIEAQRLRGRTVRYSPRRPVEAIRPRHRCTTDAI